jgi:CRISPR-associated protein (Cas_Cmr5)
MLRTAGLAATYAYLVAKSDDTELGRAYQKVADGIRRHLTERSRLVRPVGSNRELIAKLAELPAADYVRAAAEVELLAGWLRRLGEAEYRAGNPSNEPNPANPQEAG